MLWPSKRYGLTSLQAELAKVQTVRSSQWAEALITKRARQLSSSVMSLSSVLAAFSPRLADSGFQVNEFIPCEAEKRFGAEGYPLYLNIGKCYP